MIIALGGQNSDKAIFFKDGNRCASVKSISWKGVNQDQQLEFLIGSEIYNQLKDLEHTEFPEHPRLVSFFRQKEFDLNFNEIVKITNDKNRIRYNNYREKHGMSVGDYDYVYTQAHKGQLYFKEWDCTAW